MFVLMFPGIIWSKDVYTYIEIKHSPFHVKSLLIFFVELIISSPSANIPKGEIKIYKIKSAGKKNKIPISKVIHKWNQLLLLN